MTKKELFESLNYLTMQELKKLCTKYNLPYSGSSIAPSLRKSLIIDQLKQKD